MRQETITIGGLRLCLRSAHDGFWSAAERCYGGFFADGEASPDETIEVAVVPDAEVPIAEGKMPMMRLSERNGSLHLAHGRGIAEWDRSTHRAFVRQAERDFGPQAGPHPQYFCDTLVRAILARRLVERQGCLIHAASLVREGRGYLFVGASGAGKSTVARLSAPTCTVLSDDLSLVSASAVGVRIFGTPFLGEFQAATADGNAPLAAICFLRQAQHNALAPAPRRLAVRELLSSVLLPGSSRAANQATLDLIAALPGRVPCYELDFLPEPSFWRCLDDLNDPGAE